MESHDPRRLGWLLWTLALLGIASLGACNPSPSGGGGPTSGVCTIGPCSGTLSGAFSQPFTCTQTFGNFGLQTQAGTAFVLSVQSLPTGVTSLGMDLDFTGAPPTALPSSVSLLGSAAPSPLRAASIGLSLSDNSSFLANVGPPDTGSMTLTLTDVQYRDGGTPGDVCLHGHVSATLAHQSGPTGGPGDSVFLEAGF